MDNSKLDNCWIADPNTWTQWIVTSLLLGDRIRGEEIGSVAYAAILPAEDPGAIAQRIATMLYQERAQSLGRN